MTSQPLSEWLRESRRQAEGVGGKSKADSCGRKGTWGAEVLRAGPAGAESEAACCRAPSRERGGG